MVPARAPEQKRGVLERGTAKLYLLRIGQNSYSVLRLTAPITGVDRWRS